MERVDRSPDTSPSGPARLRKAAFAAFVLAYFLYFNWGALKDFKADVRSEFATANGRLTRLESDLSRMQADLS